MKKFLSLVLALVMTMSLVTVSAGAKDFTDSISSSLSTFWPTSAESAANTARKVTGIRQEITLRTSR